MREPSRIHDAKTIAVLALDDALRESLALALDAMSYSTTVSAEGLDAISPNTLRNTSAIIADCALLTPVESLTLSKLRESGWTGMLIVMSEDETGCKNISEEKYEAIDLVKPFGLHDLIAAMDRAS